MGMLLRRHRKETPQNAPDSLDNKTIKELVEMCREQNIDIPKKSKKDDIIALLNA